MKKIFIVVLCTVLLTGCGNNKKEEVKPVENKDNKVIVETSPNVNFDLIDTKYKEVLDEYLGYVPLRKLSIYDKDAYIGSKVTLNDLNNGILAISSTTIFKRNDKEIKACGENIEDCAYCFDDNNCMLISEMIEKFELNYNKFVTPNQILNELNNKQGLDSYTNSLLKISKVLSFESEGDDLYIYEKAAFAYLENGVINVYDTTTKQNKVLTINNTKLNSKEVIDEVINNIDKFRTFKHYFKTREQESDFYYYWYSTDTTIITTESANKN